MAAKKPNARKKSRRNGFAAKKNGKLKTKGNGTMDKTKIQAIASGTERLQKNAAALLQQLVVLREENGRLKEEDGQVSAELDRVYRFLQEENEAIEKALKELDGAKI